MEQFRLGQRVTINEPSSRFDKKSGRISYHSRGDQHAVALDGIHYLYGSAVIEVKANTLHSALCRSPRCEIVDLVSTNEI